MACPPGIADLGEGVWRGNGRAELRGIRLLGAPLGTPEFVRTFGERHVAKANALWEQIRALPRLQHAWLLFYFCLVPRINHLLRQVPPALVEQTAQAFHRLTETGLQSLLGQEEGPLPDACLRQARLPFREGGLGLRDSLAISPAAYWASWADTLPGLHARYPAVAANVLAYLQTPVSQRANNNSCLTALEGARATLTAAGVPLPDWAPLLQGVQPPVPERGEPEDEEGDPGEWRHGWQYYASRLIQSAQQAGLAQQAAPHDAARYRSCKGRNNSRWLTAIPYNEALELSNPIHQCLLRRRLGLPIVADVEACEGATCRAQLDAEGHHRSACTRTGRIHGRHAAAVQPWTQVFAEAGYRVRPERLLRDTHLPTHPGDQRRMDLVAAPGSRAVGARRGVPLFGDVTIVSVHTRAGAARPTAANTDGSVLAQAVARKRRKYADVVASQQAALLVLGCEVYGRWCQDASRIIRELAALKARQAPPLLRHCAQHAWSNRWWSMVGVGVQRAVAESLLRHAGADLQPCAPLAETPPLADILACT